MRPISRLCSLLLLASLTSGCSVLLPEVSTMPVVHNPFPQLSRVAVAPFFNLSDEPTVDGRKFAKAYFAELQSIPGFEVVPLGVVETAIIENDIKLANPGDARKLAKLLGVDAVVVGAVTDYSPYYPPRCGMRIDWYAANEGFHEIPAGYGLPWGTPDEEYIPPKVVFEAEMALARAQMETQSPDCRDAPLQAMPPVHAMPVPPKALDLPPGPSPQAKPTEPFEEAAAQPVPEPVGVPVADGFDIEDDDPDDPLEQSTIEQLPEVERRPVESSDSKKDPVTWRPQRQATFKVPIEQEQAALAPGAIVRDGVTVEVAQNNYSSQLPPDWPDPRGFMPPGPSPVRPTCIENSGPVLTHTRIFLGHDPEFTAALAAYVDFRDDARFGGWRSYLERSDDFIRFCCHLHLSEMLSARGGATETRVVRHWSNSR